MTKKTATTFIFDLDGVLFDNSHREHLLPTGDGKTAEQWDAFNKACRDDKPIMHMWQLLRVLTDLSYDGSLNTEIAFLTGRSEVCRQETLDAMADVLQICEPGADRRAIISACDDALLMRDIDDHRPGHEIKREEILSLIRGYTKGRRVVLLDDDPAIIEACRDLVDQAILVEPFTGCAAIRRAQAQRILQALADPALGCRGFKVPNFDRGADIPHPFADLTRGRSYLAPCVDSLDTGSAPFFVLPKGYKMVPVVPTPEMLAAGREVEGACGDHCEDIWRAMVNAAPAMKDVFESTHTPPLPGVLDDLENSLVNALEDGQVEAHGLAEAIDLVRAHLNLEPKYQNGVAGWTRVNIDIKESQK